MIPVRYNLGSHFHSGLAAIIAARPAHSKETGMHEDKFTRGELLLQRQRQSAFRHAVALGKKTSSMMHTQEDSVQRRSAAGRRPRHL